MQTRSSDVLIYPDVDFVPALTKDPEILRRGIAAGQKAADSVAARLRNEILAAQERKAARRNPAIGTSDNAISK